MSSVRLSLSLPDETHPNLEVSVEQPGAPEMVFSVPLAPAETSANAEPVTHAKPVRTIKGARTKEQDDYELGGYAGI